MPTIPTFIGRFKIVSQIGKGGMGALYLAWDPTLEREIAIKLLRDDNDDLRERFAREARSVARLRHPHIVTVFDVGVHEEQPFIAMEYIKGQTLAEIIGSGARLSIVRKLQLAEELCDGLAFAHKAGIVHRDVKPANIIVDEGEGSLKLLDFGIARVGPGMTQAGMLIGTLNYMSPEQVVGGAVDGRSDIFAVGTVLYELLARRQAFPGRLDTGILHKILHASPEPLEVHCSDLDPEIIQIVNRALEKDPAARYQELTTMRRDLQRILRRLETSQPADEPLDDDATILTFEARPATPTPRTPKGTDRDALERRRASQIQTFLEAAGKALDAGDHEAVIARCEEVLLLDSNNVPALDLLDRAKGALDERQADAWLDEAQQHLERGELKKAADLANRGLQLNPAAAGGPSLLRRIEEARQERERLQQRIEVCRSAVSRARDWLARGYFEDAAAAADQALAIDPAFADALSVKQQATEAAAEEAKRRQLENQRAKETLDEAHRLAQSGDAEAALRLLDDFSPSHPDITTAREVLRSEIEARRREEERRRAEALRAETERQERERRARAALDQATAALSRRDFAAALEILRALEKRDPDAAGLQTLIADTEAQRLAAERARQIDIEIRRHLDAASERLAAEDFDAAMTHVQRARALDPDHAEAQSIAGRIDDGVRAAAERREQEARRQREREQALAEAMDRAARASTHDAAIAALRDALAVDPGHRAARRLLSEHETAVDAERRVAEALARAKDASSTEAAVAALRQALQIAPAHPEARRLLHEREEDLAREQAEARRLRERQEAIAAAIRQAAAATSHAAALAALRTALDIDPEHPEARRLFDAREAALKQEQAAERRRQEIDAACHEIDTQIDSGAWDAAERSLAAFEHDPDAMKAVKPLRQRLQQAQAAAERREQEARRQREREQALAEAMGRAASASTHDAAIAALRDALAVDPDHQAARRLLSEHETAVDVERRVAAALARAKEASSTEAAVTALRQALQIAPAHPEARRLLHEREEDLAREQAEARRLRERQEAIAAAIRQAAAATSHAAALASLQTALDVEPDHPEARRLFEKREAALKQEQAAERRRQKIDAACREIDTHIDNGAWDAAERSLAAFEQDPDAKKAMKALRRRLKQARAASDRRGEAATVLIAVPPTGGNATAGAAAPRPLSDNVPTVGGRSPLVYAAAAVAVLTLLVIGYVVFIRQPAPRPAVTDSSPSVPDSTAARPQPGVGQPPPSVDRPLDQAGRAQGPADAAPSPAAPSPAAPSPTAPPPVPEAPAVTKNQAPSIESQVAPLRRLARQQLAAGAHSQALTTAVSGLRLAPKDGELLRVVNDISVAARTSAQSARQSAQAAGPAAVASAAFKDGVARQDLAARLARNRQVEPSLKAYLEAADLFTAAAAAGRRSTTAEQRPSPPPPASSASPAVAAPGAATTETPGVAVTGPARGASLPDSPPAASERPVPPVAPSAPPPAAQTQPSAPPPAAQTQPTQTPPRPSVPAATPQPQPPPVAQGANDENLIRSTLQAYAQALSALDPAAVLRVYPSLNGTALARNFEQMRSQRIQIENVQVSVTGTTATVTCQVRNHFEPKAGRATDSVVPVTFSLQKTGAGWVISQRR